MLIDSTNIEGCVDAPSSAKRVEQPTWPSRSTTAKWEKLTRSTSVQWYLHRAVWYSHVEPIEDDFGIILLSVELVAIAKFNSVHLGALIHFYFLAVVKEGFTLLATLNLERRSLVDARRTLIAFFFRVSFTVQGWSLDWINGSGAGDCHGKSNFFLSTLIYIESETQFSLRWRTPLDTTDTNFSVKSTKCWIITN